MNAIIEDTRPAAATENVSFLSEKTVETKIGRQGRKRSGEK
jgi:hypothetical protein